MEQDIAAAPERVSVFFFDRDRGMVFFLAFLVLTTIVLPAVPLSQVGQFLISLVFALTLIFGAFATMRRRIGIYLVIGLTISTFAVDHIAEFRHSHDVLSLETALRLACLSILVFVTLKRTLRPGRITGYRVIGGIAGYLLIGYAWAFAYQFLLQQLPGAIHFEPGMVDNLSRQPTHLVYFSFTTLTTVGYGDVHPIHPVARSLAIAEALIGQLYVAILIASLVGMALQAKSAEPETEDLR